MCLIFKLACKQRDYLLQVLWYLGWLVNWKKSILALLQRTEYLGAEYDSLLLKAFPTQERWLKIQKVIGHFLTLKTAPAKAWCQILGLLTSTQDFTPMGQLAIRPLQFHLNFHWKNHRNNLFFQIPISQNCKTDLEWWLDPQNVLPGVPWVTPPPEVTLTSDASQEGWGAHLGALSVKGTWSPEERDLHINWKELKCIHLAVLHFQSLISNKSLMIKSDNTVALAYLEHQGGTRSWALFSLAREILLLLHRLHTQISVQHIAGHLNTWADILSRPKLHQATEWSLHPSVTQAIFLHWETPQIDLFATKFNSKLPIYCSIRPDPQAYAIDSLSFPWTGMVAYAYPPPQVAPVSSEQNRDRPLSDNFDLPIVAQGPMVHETIRSFDSCATQTTHFSDTTETTPNTPNVPSKSRTFKSTRLEIIKHHISQKGFSRKALKRIINRHRTSTGAQYEAKWQQYLCWCHQRNTHPLNPSEILIADFLVYLFEVKKFCPATVIGYRTMLIQTFKFFPEINFDLLNNCYIQAILQNIKIACPASRFNYPKWDLAVVLRALMKHPFEPIVSIPIDLLTYKTAFLLTLAASARASEMHALSYHSFSRDRYWNNVWLSPSESFLAKNQTSRAPDQRRHFKVPALTTVSDDTSARYLCPVRALRIYLAKTHNRRKGKKLLFIAISPNYPRDITKNTLTNYIKQAILRAYKSSSDQDITLSNCSVHEVRRLGTSIAFKYNVSLEKLMQNCTWSSDLIFSNYYLRDLALQSADLYRLPGFVCAGQKLKNKQRR